jgi:hypothetical protein
VDRHLSAWEFLVYRYKIYLLTALRSEMSAWGGWTREPRKMAFHVETEGLSVKWLTATDGSKPKGRTLLEGARYMRAILATKCPYHLLPDRHFITHVQALHVFNCVVCW